MSEYLALEARVAALEQRQQLESRLRASVDFDLSALQEKAGVTLSLVQAVAAVQSDHSRRLAQTELTLTRVESTLAEHTEVLSQHTELLNQHTAKLDELDGKVDALAAGLDTVQAGVAELLSRGSDTQDR